MSEPALVRDSIYVTEVLLDSSAEQSVELDYVFPDYYPNIFKLLKTSISPAIQSCKASGNQLSFDGTALVRVLYLAEDTGELCCVTQTLPFSKTVELPSPVQNPAVQVLPRCYFASGRAVNQRRLDIRGGISCKIRVSDQREQPLITGGSGAGLQFRLKPLSICGRHLTGSKNFVLNEELELGTAKPPFGTLLRYTASAVSTETRLIANKAICKADCNLFLVYLPEGGGRPETMEFSLPVSQIIDLPGVDDSFSCAVHFAVTGVQAEPKAADSPDGRSIQSEISLTAFCTADKNQDCAAADDAFSTLYETELTARPVCAERLIQQTDLTVMTRSAVQTASPIAEVCDVQADFGEYAVKYGDGVLSLEGNLEISAFCIGPDGVPFLAEQTVPAELRLLTGLEAAEISFLPQIEVLSCGYTIASDNELNIRAELRVSGPVYEKYRFSAMTEIAVKEDVPRERDPLCALRICYAEPGDSLWEIAKTYSTSMSAVLEENHLESEQLDTRTMLLIPLIDG